MRGSGGAAQIGFVPAASHGHDGQRAVREWLDYYHEHKLLLRFARDRGGADA